MDNPAPAKAGEEQSPGGSLLHVDHLSVCFPATKKSRRVQPVSDFWLDVNIGEKVGMVGESGSGKSLAARSMMGLLSGVEVKGNVLFEGRDLLSLSQATMQSVRGAEIGLIFQEPISALNPLMTIGDQMIESLRVHGVSKRAARLRARDWLGRVGVADASKRMDDYPHQFSGGMCQRVMIATALIAEPKLLIADEPTTALDVRIQAQVLDLLAELSRERDMALLLITHDISVVANYTESMIVMYAGRTMESGPTPAIISHPFHPYTRDLMESTPAAWVEPGAPLPTIPGRPPSPEEIPRGCPYHPRCQAAQTICTNSIPQLAVAGDGSHLPRRVACYFPEQYGEQWNSNPEASE